jgi:peptidoglycan/xylan/chitin deacetylase (PgdA/CDA1 family)
MTHSVMFHHFHDNFHLPSQGSLSALDFDHMISWLSDRYDILNAQDYKSKFLSQSLKNTDICLSFDDALKCQYDIALPVLRKNNISAFFFVYSSAFSDNPDSLEIFRYFRNNKFDSVDEFYNYFFDFLIQNDKDEYLIQQSQYSSLGNYLSAFPFYTENDKWFRYLRDQYLGNDKYKNVMLEIISDKGVNINEVKKNLWMREDELLKIHEHGHVVGLHSYSHPTQMSKMTVDQQLKEYQQNLTHLSNVLKTSEINSMSHPCGDYNMDTLSLLKRMGIQIGFRSNMGVKEIKSPLEIPREDHANVFKEMKQ